MSIVVYTGTQVWQGRPEIRGSRTGRVEYGPGLYFTTSLQTARKYGKGQRTVLRVEIDPSFTWLEDAHAPTELLVQWVNSRRGLRHKKEIIDDILNRAERQLDPKRVPVDVLVTLMVNYEAITGSHGPDLAAFLTSLGIGASHVQRHSEDWIVLFDPSKVISWRRVAEGDEHDLPPVRKR